jgi:hypothetical protein
VWRCDLHLNHSNISAYTGADISAGNKKCETCAKTVILETVCVYVILMCCENSRELPEDGVD